MTKHYPKEFRSKKALIEKFVDSINNDSDIEGDWHKFISKAFADGELKTAGTAVSKLLPTKNMFSPSFEHSLQKAYVIDKLKAFFERFSNL
jgi:type I restriction enzyme R subunit